MNQTELPEKHEVTTHALDDLQPSTIGGLALDGNISPELGQTSAESVFQPLDDGTYIFWSDWRYRDSASGNTESSLVTNINPRYFRIHTFGKVHDIGYDDRHAYLALPVTVFDELPGGEYQLTGRDANFGYSGVSKRVTIFEENGDRFYSLEETKVDPSEDFDEGERSSELFNKPIQPIGPYSINGCPTFVSQIKYPRISTIANRDSDVRELKKLGFAFDESVDPEDGHKKVEIVRAPTPKTLQKYASKAGLSIKLVDSTNEDGKLPSLDYIAAFAERSFPVGVAGAAELYNHDVAPGHITALTQAPNLMDYLEPIAKAALVRGDEGSIAKATVFLDVITDQAWELLGNEKNVANLIDYYDAAKAMFIDTCEYLGVDNQFEEFFDEISKARV